MGMQCGRTAGAASLLQESAKCRKYYPSYDGTRFDLGM